MRLTREELSDLRKKESEAKLHTVNIDKQKLREELDEKMQEFLAKGGKIKNLSIAENNINSPDFNRTGALEDMRKRNKKKSEIKEARISKQKPYLDAFYEKFGDGSWSELSRRTGGKIQMASISKCYYGTASIVNHWEMLKKIIIDELGMDLAA